MSAFRYAAVESHDGAKATYDAGNTHLRLTAEEVSAMLIPVPADRKVQDAIADQEGKSRVEAKTSRVKAERDWTTAKQYFGDCLLA